MEAPSERKGKRGGNALDARNGAQALLDLARESSTLIRCASATAQNLEGQKAVGVKARIDALEFQETAEHQSRSDEQHEGESNFCHHYKFSQQAAAGKTFVSATAPQHIHDVRSPGTPSGSHAENPCG